MKEYLFTDDSYWASNGCDCCEDTFLEAYNSEDVDHSLGSASSIEDCYVQAIVTETGSFCIGSTMHEILRGKSLAELKDLARLMKIEVSIIV